GSFSQAFIVYLTTDNMPRRYIPGLHDQHQHPSNCNYKFSSHEYSNAKIQKTARPAAFRHDCSFHLPILYFYFWSPKRRVFNEIFSRVNTESLDDTNYGTSDLNCHDCPGSRWRHTLPCRYHLGHWM